MLQHRHVYPGLNNDEPCGWHDAARVHAKYPTAHDDILEEREFTPGTRAKKAKAPEYSFNEYGEQVVTTAPAPPTAGELEYAFLMEATTVTPLDADAMVKEAAAHLMKTAAKNAA